MTNKVYIVFDELVECDMFVGVYSFKEDAEEWVNQQENPECFKVEEFDLQ